MCLTQTKIQSIDRMLSLTRGIFIRAPADHFSASITSQMDPRLPQVHMAIILKLFYRSRTSERTRERNFSCYDGFCHGNASIIRDLTWHSEQLHTKEINLAGEASLYLYKYTRNFYVRVYTRTGYSVLYKLRQPWTNRIPGCTSAVS